MDGLTASYAPASARARAAAASACPQDVEPTGSALRLAMLRAISTADLDRRAPAVAAKLADLDARYTLTAGDAADLIARDRARDAAHPAAAMITAIGAAVDAADDDTFDELDTAHRRAVSLVMNAYRPGAEPRITGYIGADAWPVIFALADAVDVPRARI